MGWNGRLPKPMRRLAPRLIHTAARFTRPLTLGVRAILLRESPQGPDIFLVKHSYVSGWHLPGGAVEPGETIGAALRREVEEECRIAVTGPPSLLGLYFNQAASRRDHVAVFVVRTFEVLAERKADWEIVEAGFFSRRALPAGTGAPVLARLAEALDGVPPREHW